jgi:hypothetical protein
VLLILILRNRSNVKSCCRMPSREVTSSEAKNSQVIPFYQVMQKRRLHAKEKETDAHLLPPFPQRIFGNAANQGFLGLPQQLLLFYSFSLRRGWEKKNMNNYAMHTREIYLSAYPSCQILTPLYGALSIAAVVRILFISLSLSLSLSLSSIFISMLELCRSCIFAECRPCTWTCTRKCHCRYRTIH